VVNTPQKKKKKQPFGQRGKNVTGCERGTAQESQVQQPGVLTQRKKGTGNIKKSLKPGRARWLQNQEKKRVASGESMPQCANEPAKGRAPQRGETGGGGSNLGGQNWTQ